MFQTNHSRTSMTPRPSEGGLGESAYSWSLRSPSASLWQGSFYCTCACTSDTDLLLERWDTYTRPSKFLGSFNATLNVLEANAPSGEGLSLHPILSKPQKPSLRLPGRAAAGGRLKTGKATQKAAQDALYRIPRSGRARTAGGVGDVAGHPRGRGRMGRSDEKLMQLTTANEWKERSYGPANRRGGTEAARAAGRRMDPRGQAARRAAVAGRGTGHNRMA